MIIIAVVQLIARKNLSYNIYGKMFLNILISNEGKVGGDRIPLPLVICEAQQIRSDCSILIINCLAVFTYL